MIEFYRDKAREYRWRAVAANGEIIGAASEGFETYSGAALNLRTLATAVISRAAPHPGGMDIVNVHDERTSDDES